MPAAYFSTALACAAALFPQLAGGADDHTLGEYPLCEASAATPVRCPGSAGRCIAVADNERDRHLFLFRLGKGSLEFDQTIRLVDDKNGDNLRIGDLEALLSLDDSTVVAFGSHARSSTCKSRNKRRRAGIVHLRDDEAPTSLLPALELSCAPTVSDWRVLSVCAHLRAVHQAAEDIAVMSAGTKTDKKRAKRECARLAPLNIEGAVQIGRHQWIGLRSPLMSVDSGSARLAVMLRLSLPGAAVEDAALLDLGGSGIRALGQYRDWVFGIAGPATRAKGAFRLFRFAADRLGRREPIAVEFLSLLPDSAEGLVVHDGAALVIIDGSDDPMTKTCSKPARYRVVPGVSP